MAVAEPRISLCLIVRDEQEQLPRCLGSTRGAADEVVVVDTGSRDATRAVARDLGARVIDLPWPDSFALARNAALAAAGGEWILCLDADEALAPGAPARIRALTAGGGADAYLCTVVNLVGSRRAPEQQLSLGLRLFRNRPEHRFAGAVHEQLQLPPGARVAHGGFGIIHWGYLEGGLGRKGERNLALARRMAAADPADPLVRFHLATALYQLARYGEAAAQCREALDRRPPREQPWVSNLVRTRIACLLAGEAYEQALAELADWLPVYPAFTDLVFLQGLALLALGRLPAARAAFARCLELGPAPVPPHDGAQASLGGSRARFMLQMIAALGEDDHGRLRHHPGLQPGGHDRPLPGGPGGEPAPGDP